MFDAMNHAISDIFKEMSLIYKYLGAEERFRSLAYAKASHVIDGLKDDISVYIDNNSLEQIPGIGEGMAEKIREYAKTGKIRKYEELKKRTPFELLELMSVSGFGPESIRKIHNELGLVTRQQLIKALDDGSISSLKGFGSRKIELMLRGLKLYKQSHDRMLLWDALNLGEQIVTEMKKMKEIIHIELAGSLRRRSETIGDIDILVACSLYNRKKVVNKFTKIRGSKIIFAQGNTKASILIKDYNRQVDLRLVDKSEWGSALLYLTGSKEHNVRLRTMAKGRGLKINEYGVFRLKDNKKIAGESEEDVYACLGYPWIPPEMREDKGELDLLKGKITPKLVELKDIQGDLQMHSDWSDGNMSIKDLAGYVLQNYTYKYIVLTDHSKSSRIAGGLNEKEFRSQIKLIKTINRKLGKEFLKAGAEVDILADGSLDLSDDLLSQLDWVCASIHSGFNGDNTARLIKACRNPFVNCIGHPTGRLIGKREAYLVNWTEVFKTAAATNTAMEINSQPNRLDLNDELAKQARGAGVKLVISTDSHDQNNYAFIKLGVFVARRAWCTKADILNTGSWTSLRKFAETKLKLSKFKVTE